MKQKKHVLLPVLTVLFALSCHFADAQPYKQLPDGVTCERLLYKNNMEQFKRAAFSLDGERFLLSDGYTVIRLWQRPFASPSRDLRIEDYGAIAAMKFFGDQGDIFLAYEGGLVQIWDRDLRVKKFEFRFPYPAKMAAITADGRFIAADGELYDRQKKSLVGHGVTHAFYSGVCFSGSSLLLTAGYHDHRIAVRNVYSGEYQYRQIPYPVTGAGISANGEYVVSVTNEGRFYLWHWPDQEAKVLPVPEEKSYFIGFSPDSKWFVTYGTEFLHIFQTNPTDQIARLQPQYDFNYVGIVSNNLIVMGDVQGYVHIYDVSSGKTIARQKVIEHAVGPVELVLGKGYLWVGSSYYDLKKNDHGEIALYHLKGLQGHIDPQSTAAIK
jgi:WD40 repeat protein